MDRKIKEPGLHYAKQASIIKSLLGSASVRTLLDVGTEDGVYLREMSRQLGCESRGLNVQEGFDHYLGRLDESIVLYDGRRMPFEDRSYDLVTANSVLHHVSQEDLPTVVGEMCRVSSNMVIIKENYVFSAQAFREFVIQHDIYEGVFFASAVPEDSRMNDLN